MNKDEIIKSARKFRPDKNGVLRNNLCPYCDEQMTKGFRYDGAPSKSYPTIDHILPKAWGGLNRMENYRIVCIKCNNLRAVVGHCVGAMACLRTVAEDRKIKVSDLMVAW